MSFSLVLVQIWVQCFSIWLHYLTTVTLFPSILIQVRSVTPSFFLPSKFLVLWERFSCGWICELVGLEFVDAVVLINFALFNLLGNFLAGCIKKVRNFPSGLFINQLLFLALFTLGIVLCLHSCNSCINYLSFR